MPPTSVSPAPVGSAARSGAAGSDAQRPFQVTLAPSAPRVSTTIAPRRALADAATNAASRAAEADQVGRAAPGPAPRAGREGARDRALTAQTSRVAVADARQHGIG